jgi:hypothetical protein
MVNLSTVFGAVAAAVPDRESPGLAGALADLPLASRAGPGGPARGAA